MRCTRALGGVLLAMAIGASRTARADGPSCTVGDRACGREAFAQGTANFDSGQYDKAIAWFTAAQSAAAHPIIAFNVALCHARLGKVNRARAELASLATDPALDRDLRDRAKRELSGVEARVARVVVEAPDPATNVIEIDGEQAESAGHEVMIDPGPHRIRVLSAKVVVFDQDVELASGEHLRLRVSARARTIDVVVVPEGTTHRSPVDASETVAPPGRSESATPSLARSGLHPGWFYAASAMTVLGVASTAWSGVDSQNAYSAYKADLPGLTQEQADARVADGRSRELRTNVLLGGVALCAAGTALLGFLWTDWHPKASRQDGTKVVLRPTGTGLAVAF